MTAAELLAARKRLGLSRRKLGLELGVAGSTLQEYERGWRLRDGEQIPRPVPLYLEKAIRWLLTCQNVD